MAMVNQTRQIRTARSVVVAEALHLADRVTDQTAAKLAAFSCRAPSDLHGIANMMKLFLKARAELSGLKWALN